MEEEDEPYRQFKNQQSEFINRQSRWFMAVTYVTGMDSQRLTTMGFLPAHGLATRVIPLPQARQGIGGWRGLGILLEDGFKSLDRQILDGGAAAGGGDLRLLEKGIRKVDGRFHMAIFTGNNLVRQVFRGDS
jgi:hypothetical protein